MVYAYACYWNHTYKGVNAIGIMNSMELNLN
jgi:hypothetical protein